MSYNGQVQLWINADSNVCPNQGNAEELSNFILEELEDLKEFAALVEFENMCTVW